MQQHFQEVLGTRFAWLSDEWYWWRDCLCRPGITTRISRSRKMASGSIRAFLEALDAATEDLPSAVPGPRRCSWVVGQIVAQALQPVAERLNAVDGVEFHLIGLPSPYWGQEQVVTGLLTGQDLLTGLQGQELGDELLLPSVMLRQGEPVFLDDMTLEALAAQLPVPIQIVHGAADVVDSVLGVVGKSP
jgi:putative radical SAM enzyme (TIGR03279 family)